MKDLKFIFGLLPLCYAIIGYLPISNEWFWTGFLILCFSAMFGVLFFGITIQQKR